MQLRMAEIIKHPSIPDTVKDIDECSGYHDLSPFLSSFSDLIRE
jgi:hypothetical protein